MKIVVFDLDETLGYFTELGMFWDALHSYIREKNIPLPINQELFNNVLILYLKVLLKLMMQKLFHHHVLI